MKPRPRIRKTVKWGGAVVSVILLVVWVGSGWIYLEWTSATGACVIVASGRVGMDTFGDSSVELSPGWHVGRNPHPFYFHSDWEGQIVRGFAVYIPLWHLAILAALPTATAWRLDTLARRRARAGFCPKCRYDRAGLPPQSVCPECGAAALAPPPAAS